MKYKIYQIDAFTDRVFSGNPAAVVPLEQWPGDDLLQKIAMENNLSETAFYIDRGDHYLIRWFTPAVEVDLCGHATLAAAYVLFNHENHKDPVIRFLSGRSGMLTVTRQNGILTLNFPADQFVKIGLTADLAACFNLSPTEAFRGKTDLLLLFESEDQVKNLKPDLARIAAIDARGVIVTAKGDTVDFVSRFFGPQSGVDEDPVTGSAHTTLTPFWAARLNRNELSAVQLSKRKGILHCRYAGDRVEISGNARTYLIGEIFIE